MVLEPNMRIYLDEIFQNPHQIRSVINDDELKELAESINAHGLLQPIKVRPMNGGYQLIYGHRRIAAMRLLGWKECEAIIENVDDTESLIQSIAENLQRENLDIIEEAQSYQGLISMGYTIKEIAELVNKPHGRISNRLSILRLPKEVQELVQNRKGQHTTTTEYGGISPDSASRIASAIRNPDESIEIAQKMIGSGMTSRDIREFTSLLKGIEDADKRSQFINTNWEDMSKSDVSRTATQNERLPDHQVESLDELFHRKALWNLQRIDLKKYDHFTIGYSSRTIIHFLELLKLAKIDLLIDIRYVPISRFRPDYSMINLKSHLKKAGIQYIHIQELGIPTEIRRDTGEKNDLFTWYDAHVDLNKVLLQIERELSIERIAFMCVEIDPQSCHRHRVSQYLEKQGYNLIDL